MRYEKGRKEETRQNIMNVATRQFKENGVSAAGLASIMTEAGLTNGAFYAHFGSKNDLLRESLEAAWLQLKDETERIAAEKGLEAVVRGYLSEAHRDNAGEGCPSATLLPDVARQPSDVRRTYTENFLEFIEIIARYLPDEDESRARRTARTMFALAVGTLQLARAVDDPELSSEILEDGIQQILLLLQ